MAPVWWSSEEIAADTASFAHRRWRWKRFTEHTTFLLVACSSLSLSVYTRTWLSLFLHRHGVFCFNLSFFLRAYGSTTSVSPSGSLSDHFWPSMGCINQMVYFRPQVSVVSDCMHGLPYSPRVAGSLAHAHQLPTNRLRSATNVLKYRRRRLTVRLSAGDENPGSSSQEERAKIADIEKERKLRSDGEVKEWRGKAGWKGIVPVNPKPRNGLASKAIDFLEGLIVRFMFDSSEPHYYLSGNFAPVPDETPPCKDLPVKGHLPECLNGEFVMIASNPKFAPVAGYHWFDGDGMVHGIRFKDGNATYCSRYVRTSRLSQEEFFGGAKFIKIGDIKGLYGLVTVIIHMLRAKLQVLDVSYGIGTANTALVYHHGKLLALQETDRPYVLRVLEDGDLQTLGMLDYDKRLTHSFTAHPKVDPFTGEMFTFGYAFRPPYITYRVISKDGVMHDPVSITIPAPVMMHDFAITENYAIFMNLPVFFKPKDIVLENKLAFSFDKTKNARFGILPRYAKNEHLIEWFELPSCCILHCANAWENEDEVVLITCRIENPDLDMFVSAVKPKPENVAFELYEMRFNMKTGLASQKKLSPPAVEFPRINENYTGRKQRYVYGSILERGQVTAIIKFDLHAEPDTSKMKLEVGGNVQGIFELGAGQFGSEGIFVPREHGINSEEDDGHIIFFVGNEKTGKSSVYVIDAKTMAADPVAVVELPRRVPVGFHASFLTEEQLKQQAM
ncbi:hypothetical protein Nepgr_020064 [Nepenthes gracilis]|uniref:carotenoid 9,10-dioxygenase n=1 Tax=Nepenthes gracilis TaxID=150966 RepID=A0AAD3XUY2_NEPGR|nr:hypothetical protein Nepgr_020064 [Nepenthes gracilis]